MKYRILVALAAVGLLTAEASAFGRRHRGGCNTGYQTVSKPTCSQTTYVLQQTVYFGGCSTCPIQTAYTPFQPVRNTIDSIGNILFPNCNSGACSPPNSGVIVTPASTSGPQIIPAPNR
jgi:hypothetical protein